MSGSVKWIFSTRKTARVIFTICQAVTGKEYCMSPQKTILMFIIKCISIPAAAVIILFLLNIPYREIDDEKYMDMWNLRMLGNQINEVEIANVGSSHGAYDFIYDELTEDGYS